MTGCYFDWNSHFFATAIIIRYFDSYSACLVWNLINQFFFTNVLAGDCLFHLLFGVFLGLVVTS